MEATTTLISLFFKSEVFKAFTSYVGGRVIGEYARYRFIEKASSSGGKNLEIAEAERRYLEEKNDRDKESLKLQKKHLDFLLKKHQDNIDTSIKKIQADHDLIHWSGIMSRDETLSFLTNSKSKHCLLLILSEPDISRSCPDSFCNDLPQEVRSEVKQFIEKFYPVNSKLHPVDFFGKFFHSTIFDTHVKQLDNLLSSVPGVVLYSDVTDEKFYLHLHTWGSLEPLSETIVWNWEEAKDLLLAQDGYSEKQVLRAIRNIIVALYQSFAALLIDLYYLSVNPLYEPVSYNLEKESEVAQLTKSFIGKLKLLQKETKEAYEQSCKQFQNEQLPSKKESNKSTPNLSPTHSRKIDIDITHNKYDDGFGGIGLAYSNFTVMFTFKLNNIRHYVVFDRNYVLFARRKDKISIDNGSIPYKEIDQGVYKYAFNIEGVNFKIGAEYDNNNMMLELSIGDEEMREVIHPEPEDSIWIG